MRKRFTLLWTAMLLLTLAGCQKQNTPTIQRTNLSQETQTALSQLGFDQMDYMFYDYQVGEEIQGIIFQVLMMDQEHQWINGGSVMVSKDDAVYSSSGRLCSRVDPDHTVALGFSGGTLTCPPPDYLLNTDWRGTISTWLGPQQEIVPDEEIPIFLKYFSSKNSLTTPDFSNYRSQEEMAQFDAAIAITVTFLSASPT